MSMGSRRCEGVADSSVQARVPREQRFRVSVANPIAVGQRIVGIQISD